ncbi:hypothetical protein HK097_010587 [Rhizophlyctis rosea]|uniref:Uncharacterized protein n=1 Tax=Rhizophlyctis rosea TaxID=64517 RepID=A0AAD5SMY2_9FUNG|nr:hypothetical protein HK097_010587 [Rhizophlyctis rosea]
MAHIDPQSGITFLPELIDPIFRHLDVHTLSKIYTSIPSLKPQAAIALHLHLKNLTLTLGLLSSPNTIKFRCDKTLSAPRYLYYFRLFQNGHFSQGSFHDDGGGLKLTFLYALPLQPRQPIITLECNTEYHTPDQDCSPAWHTSLLKPKASTHCEPARFEHRWNFTYFNLSAVVFQLDWFVDCCNVADVDGHVELTLEEGVQSAYLRRLMERAEAKDPREEE